MQIPYSCPHLKTLEARLDEAPKFMIFVAGPRQIGKSTMVREVLSRHPSTFEATDQSATATIDPFSYVANTIQALSGAKATEKWIIDRRASPPKFNTHNTALISAQSKYTFAQAKNDRTYWGRLVKSAVGSHLINNRPEDPSLHYWRESPIEVDFLLQPVESWM